MKTEALKLAIEALKTAQNNLAPSKESAHVYGDGELWDKYADAIKALKVLAQPEQEPVASGLIRTLISIDKDGIETWKEERFYTTPPQRSEERAYKPLTDEQRNEIARQADENDWHDYDIIDAVEAAHGIKE